MPEVFILAYGILSIIGLYVMGAVAHDAVAIGLATLCAVLVYAFQIADYYAGSLIPRPVLFALWGSVIIVGFVSAIVSLIG